MASDYSQAWSPPLCSDPTLRSTLPDGALVEAFIFPETGRGLRVTRAVAKGEELLAVPLDDCWHAADARKCAELQPLLESGVALSDFDASVLQLLLSRAGKTSVSELRKAHLAEMPSAYNSTLFWSDADMAELKGSPWQQLAERLAEEVAADWAALRAFVSSAATAQPIPEEPVDVADGAADGASDGASDGANAVASATTSKSAPAASSAGSSSPPAATRYREICPAFTPQWENLTHARSAKCPIVSPSTMSSTAKEPAPASAMRTKDAIWSK